MAEAPSTRPEWRTWVRTTRPGEVRERAGVRQEDLAERISEASGARVSPKTLGGWERGTSQPRRREQAEAWHKAVTEMAAAPRAGARA